MQTDRLFTQLLAELRHRAAVDVEPAAYWRGVIDALHAIGEVAASTDLPTTAGLIAIADLSEPVRPPEALHPGDRGAGDEPASIEVEQTASWLAGFALAATRDRAPDRAAVGEAVHLVGGSHTVLDRASELLEVIGTLDPEHRGRALGLIERCREGLREA